MKLLFTIPTLRQGGSERVIATLASFLSKHHNIVVVTQDRPENCFYNIDLAVKQIHTNSLKNPLLSIIKLRKIIKNYKPDIVISFLMRQNIQTLIANHGFGIPVIVSERTSKQFYDSIPLKILSALGFIAYRLADRLVVQTCRVKNQFKNIRNKIHIIANPIKLPVQTPIIASNNEKLITVVGRLERVKSYDLLIKAFSQITNDFPDWRLEIYGDGKEKAALQDQIDKLQLNNRVKLCGTTKDVFSVLSKSTIFAMPSKFEGFPNALCEAMAVGMPVIYTDISGADELIKHGETGILIEPGNLDQTAEALRLLIKNPDLRKTLGENAKKHVTENFSIEKIGKQWEQLFEDLCKKKC